MMPVHIKEAMEAWQAGIAPFPASYVEWQEQEAKDKLVRLEKTGLFVFGMETESVVGNAPVLTAIAEFDGRQIRLRWDELLQCWTRNVAGEWKAWRGGEA